MRRFLMTLAAAAAVWFLPVHVGLLAVLLYIWASAAASTTNTAKTRAVETRVNNLQTSQTAQNQRVNNLSGNDTGTGLPAGVPTSTGSNGGVTSGVVSGPGSDEVGAADNGGVTSGQIGGAAAHYHAMAHAHPYSHYHADTHTHDFDGHTHQLPTV